MGTGQWALGLHAELTIAHCPVPIPQGRVRRSQEARRRPGNEAPQSPDTIPSSIVPPSRSFTGAAADFFRSLRLSISTATEKNIAKYV